MSDRIATISGTGQETAILANSHSANGGAAKSVPDVALAQTTPADAGISPELCIDALGCTIASAAIGRSAYLLNPGGSRLHAGFSLIIATPDPSPVSAALGHILSPLKYEQAKRHVALAGLDRDTHTEMLKHARADLLEYQQSELMPDPEHAGHYATQIADLENQLRPMLLLQNPAPGRLTLAIERSASAHLCATYDDLALGSLLDAARSPRGRLDFEVLAKSFNQETFDGAFLERVHDVPIISPLVSAVITARPETVARLLLCEDQDVARFADGCLILNLADSVPSHSTDVLARRQTEMWQQAVARLVETCPDQPGIVQMCKQALAVMENFREQTRATALKDGLGEQSRYLGQLPTLASKIAMGLWAGCEDASDCLTAEHASKAVEIAEMNSRSRKAILDGWAGDWAKTEFDRLCESTLEKITAFGPISGRDLCRRCHRMTLEQLLPVLGHLIEARKVIKGRDGKFDACHQSLPELQVAEAGKFRLCTDG